MSEHDDVEVWDFAVPDKPKRFRFNGPEVYEAPAMLPPKTIRALASMRGALNSAPAEQQIDLVRDLVANILTAESAKRFIERFESSDDPIDIQRQLVPCIHRLIEAYGLRPTEPSPSSSTGGDGTGTTSTDGAQPEALIPRPSLPTVGSTSATTGS